MLGAYFFALQITLYGMISFYVSSRVIDTVLAGFNRRKSMLIISDRSEEIVRKIFEPVNRGVTLLKRVYEEQLLFASWQS